VSTKTELWDRLVSDMTEQFLDDLRERFMESRARAEFNAEAFPKSYGAGYELGYSDALGELLERLTEGEQ